MRIVIAGGHGKIALRLAAKLAERGDRPVALVRNPEHTQDVEAVGAEPVVIDLEKATVTELTEKMMNADAVRSEERRVGKECRSRGSEGAARQKYSEHSTGRYV